MPGSMASSWTSSASLPYSSSYDSEMVVKGSLPGLRAQTKPAFKRVGEGGAQDEAARLGAQDDVDVAADRPLGHAVDGGAQALRVLQQRHDVAKEDAGLGKVGDRSDLGGEVDSWASGTVSS